jgi:hypothetical protein
MSFAANQSQQIGMQDKFLALTNREKAMLMESWAKSFAEKIFPFIREEKFSVLYSEKASRPNTPVNVIVGGMIIKELLQLTDDEVMAGLMFDIRFQYALHTTSFAEQPMSDRTFSRFRERLFKYEQATGEDLIKNEVIYLADKIAELMNLQPYLKRMDSLMIASACKDMTRLEVVYVTVSNLVKAVHRACGDELLTGMEHYLNADDRNRVIYHNKAEDSAEKIQSIIEDCVKLLEGLGDGGAELPEYALAKRLLEDQSLLDSSGKRIAKNKHTIAPDSLQNPSDPEATYRKKAGNGYIGFTANVVQTFNTEGAAVITDYSFEQNRHSDSDFSKEAIENIAESGIATPEKKVVMIADALFGGAENEALAEKNNIELITTALTGTKPPEVFADFEIDAEANQVIQCPAGHRPIRQGHNMLADTYRIVMEKKQCETCPHREECKAKMQQKSAVVTVSVLKVDRARTAQQMTSEEYAQFRNARNAIEGIPSVLRRRYDVDDMPAFGLQRSKLLFGFKVAAINFKKLMKYTREQCTHLFDNFAPREQCA